MKITGVHSAVWCFAVLLVGCGAENNLPAVVAARAEPVSREEAVRIGHELGTMKPDTPPEQVYALWNQFCKAHFGAEKEPLVYDLFGRDLRRMQGGDWRHVSETSACIAWETNLPARTYVEYGQTPAYGQRTSEPERPFYIHVHYLKDLKPETTYHYRLVSVDERGNPVVSKDETFTTKTPAGAVHVPGDLAGPPYVLNKPNTTYVLTENIITAGTAFEVTASGITLDLGGNTIVFAQGGPPEASGITAGKRQIPDLKILNGTIRQGMSPRMAEDKHCTNSSGHGSAKNARGFKNIYVGGANIEIAGVTVDYHAPQVFGAYIVKPSGDLDIHHNVFLDRGCVICDRHASVRTLGFINQPREANAFKLHHNLIKRTRQIAMGFANYMANNEIYVDSWSTNSFALQPNSVPDTEAGELHHNRIFTTGFNPYGFTWAHKDLKVHHNLVHMQGIDAKSRWPERWGDISMSSAMRVTNYGKGGQKRENLQYYDNLLVLKGRGGCELRGTQFFSDETIRDLVCRDSVIKVEVEDGKTDQVACVTTHGHFAKADTCLPVWYKDCTLISNMCHVRMGDKYGRGSNHRFIRCKLVRTGADPRYHTVIVDGYYWCRRNVFLDCEFLGGAAYDDVMWKHTSPTSFYEVQWTLTVNAPPRASVTIKDKNGEVEFEGNADAKGLLEVPLRQCIVRPPRSFSCPSTGKRIEVRTPHTVTVESAGRTMTKDVEMTKKRQISVVF